MSFEVSSLDIPTRTHNPGPIEDITSPPAARKDKLITNHETSIATMKQG